LGAEIAAAVGPGAAAAIGDGLAQDDELREVLVQRREAVGGPGADGGEGAALAGVAAVLEGELGAVVVVDRPQRADDGDVIGAGLADLLEPIADEQAALTVGLVAGVQRHEQLAIAVGGVGADDVLVDAGGIEDGFERRVIDGLAGILVEGGLDVEGFDVGDAAAEEDPDDGFGARDEGIRRDRGFGI
jgi:hypothetical protein